MERPPEPAPAPDELQAGALWANNIARVAALAVDQKAAEGEGKGELKKKKAKEAEKEKQKPKPLKPEEVKASTIVEKYVREIERPGRIGIYQEQLESLSPPILQFCKMFGSPSITLLVMILIHFAFYFEAPFQLKFMLPYPMAYLLPAFCSLVSIYSRKERVLWLSYWSVIATIEYLEMATFGTKYRILVWWPMIKLLGSTVLYSVINCDAKGQPVYGAVAIVALFLPTIAQ